MKTILFFLITISGNCQSLHNQAGNATTQAGRKIVFSINKQSVTEIKKYNLIIQQGFQQSNWDKIIATNFFEKK